jgi:L-threonylcarbamoyladenylate synthase
MEIINKVTENAIKKAAKALKDGHLVAFPTETVYGLGADAINEEAVSRIYSVKGRPTDHPLIVHISSINQLDKWARDIPEYAIKLARAFWPGPMTLILKRNDIAKDFITGGQDSIGLRVPSQPIALDLLAKFDAIGGLGVAAPSANRFGSVSPTEAIAVKEEIGDFCSQEDLILNGGRCSIGVESTIIDCTKSNPQILRFGAVTSRQVKKLLSLELIDFNNEQLIRTSGAFQSHYSPKATVLLDVVPKSGEGFFAFASIPTPLGVIRIAAPKNVNQFAQQLYSALRSADARGLTKIVIYSPKGDGIAIAIRDRIERASFNSAPNDISEIK